MQIAVVFILIANRKLADISRTLNIVSYIFFSISSNFCFSIIMC